MERGKGECALGVETEALCRLGDWLSAYSGGRWMVYLVVDRSECMPMRREADM